MSACQPLAANAWSGVAPALRAVDCLASETTSAAFGRLFGGSGALMPALTILLTLYIAFFAVSLLSGRARIGISALTPRMMTLGLVLTFATSWVAYQGVMWNLAIGAPDQIASVLTGTKGSATQVFADRIDLIFGAIAEVATGTGQSGQGAGAGVTSGSFTPANVMWLGALLLLLGTVGVLVTARIALAVLLAVGPVFVVLGLFPGTRGLTAGWLRGVAMTAIMPLFVVVGGGIVIELVVPIVGALRAGEGAVDGRAAIALFLVAMVHLALMVMIGKVAATTVSAWSVFGLSERQEPAGEDSRAAAAGSVTAPAASSGVPFQPAAQPRRGAAHGMVVMATSDAPAAPSSSPAQSRTSRIVTTAQPSATGLPPLPAPAGRRARGIGSRFQSQPNLNRGIIR